MLDDLKNLHQRDSQDALGIAERQVQQLLHHFEGGKKALFPNQIIHNVVFAAEGEPAHAAGLSATWPGYGRPFEICHFTELPQYVNQNTLLVVASVFGNDSELLELLGDAERRRAMIVVIATPGKFQDIALTKKYPLFALPNDIKPMAVTLLVYKALLTMIARLEFDKSLKLEQLNTTLMPDTARWLMGAIQPWLPTIATKNNYAKQLALECVGKSVVICSGTQLAPAAKIWKVGLNKYARNIAWLSSLPDYNYEAAGWTAQPVSKPYAIIDLHSSLDNKQLQNNFTELERSLSGHRPAPEVAQVEGDTILRQMLWTILLGDFVILYTALLNGLNPTPVEIKE